MNNRILPFNESRTGFFILQNFWPVFKFFQILGVFPCKKVTDENGVIQLQPMKASMSIMLFSTWWVVFQLPPIGFFLYLVCGSFANGVPRWILHRIRIGTHLHLASKNDHKLRPAQNHT